MEPVHFVLPAYWEISEWLNNLDLILILSPMIAFCLGFFCRLFLDKRAMREMRQEIADLKVRVLGAENLLSGQTKQDWQVVETVDDTSDQECTAIPEGRPVNQTLADTDLTQAKEVLPQTPRKRVCVTKVVGKDSFAAKLQTPLLGFEKAPPVVGERYQVVLQDGNVLNTSEVIKISNEYIHTVNSLYKIETVASNEDEEAHESEETGRPAHAEA
jgi:hypothetical protein